MKKQYIDSELTLEQVKLGDVAKQFGTPAYVYSRKAIEQAWLAYDNALGDYPHLVCYAVKANSNIAVLNVLARLGAGFDIVSVGELERVIEAGGDPSKVVFSGVAKTEGEMARALSVGVRCFNVESAPELERLNEVAKDMGVRAPVSIRVNPDVDAKTHPYISTGLKENKFGVSMDDAPQVYKRAHELSHLDVIGIDCHIGSQLTETQPFLDALERLCTMIDRVAEDGIEIKHIDMGGGLGIRHTDENIVPTPEFVGQITSALKARYPNKTLELWFEPGRSIVGNAGVLLTEVEFLKPTKEKNFAIIDGAMNDLIRPALYSAYMDIVPVRQRDDVEEHTYDVVGPVCETGDFLGKDRSLKIAQGDFLAVLSAGAYGFTMSSNYNTRPRAIELMVDKEEVHVIRERETIHMLMSGERLLP